MYFFRIQYKKKQVEQLFDQEYKITKEDRNKRNNHSSFVLWFTGLPCAGKSTLANYLEEFLFKKGFNTYVLDGDNIRLGLSKDLNFSNEDRSENIRRVAEVAKILMDAGQIVITSFISPLEADREIAKAIINEKYFIEVFIDCSLDVCESRDTKGLYKKARQGKIENFTGIDSTFEKPKNPDIAIKTDLIGVEECLLTLTNYLFTKKILKR